MPARQNMYEMIAGHPRHAQGALRALLLFLLAGPLLWATTARAQPQLPAPPTAQPQLIAALERPGDLTLQGSSLQGAILTIGEQWGINVVSGKLEGSVNGVFKNAPLREILDSILLSNGYGYRTVGQSLVVSRLSELGQVNPFFVSETIPITAASISEVVQGAKLLNTPNGQVHAIPSARSIVVLDFADRVEKIRRFVEAVDAATLKAHSGSAVAPVNRPLEVVYLKTHHVKAEDMLGLLDAVLSSDGKATVMKREDRLLVVDYAENLHMVRQVVQHADRPRPQVAIQALIYDISLEDMEELGINWHSITNGSLTGATIASGGALTGSDAIATGAGSLINSVTKVPFSDGSTGGAFTLYNLGSKVSISAVALLLQNAADSRLLASPNVTVLENEQATIQSVSEIPYQQLTQTAAGGNIGTTAFKEAGITLSVTPKIGADGVIEMQVRPEFSRLTGFSPGDNQPIIDKRVATTNVRIGNGETFVIGGLRQRTDIGEFNGIPILKDVRFIGPLFRSHETTVRESELMVFIRPTILGACSQLCSREQSGADTIDSRLNHIPMPEGRPPCSQSCPLPCDCPPSEELFLAPQLDAAPYQEQILPPAPDRPSPALNTPRAAERNNPNLGRRNAVRRLPPVDDQDARRNQQDTSSRIASGVGVSYDKRYRPASDGLAEIAAEKPPEGQASGNQSSGRWFSRFWR